MGEHVLQLLGPSTGGIRRHVREISARLRERGWTVTVAAPPGVLDADEVAHIVDVPSGLAPATVLRARTQLTAAVGDVDLVHAHGLKAGWLASLVPKRPPLVVTVHNLVLNEAAGAKAPVLRWMEGRLAGRADQIIAISDDIADRFGRPPHVRVVPPAGPAPSVDQPRAEVRRALGVPADAPLAAAIARLHPQKDLATLLCAAARLPALHVVIVGAGPLHGDLVALAAGLGVAERVHFTGQHENPANVMAAADVVVVTSLWESGPLALVEAMTLARPVVSTPVGLGRTLVVDGDTGRQVPIGAPAAVAEAIEAVVADPAAAAAMGERGRSAVTAALGPERLIDEIEAVYRVALAP